MNDATTPVLPAADSSGAILALIRSGVATTRARIMQVTGLSRSTVGQRLDTLIAAGYLEQGGSAASTGGRPQASLRINPAFGVMLLADIGAEKMRLALADMHGNTLASSSAQNDIAAGPVVTLDLVLQQFDGLLAAADRTRSEVKGIGIGVPGPVEFAQGRVVRPPIMTGWDGVVVPDFFAPYFNCPVRVDKDVNLMALGEHRVVWPDVAHMMYVTIGTGIGAGLIMDGRPQRGAQGGAGDLGHLFMGHAGSAGGGQLPLCRCGNAGCLEAYAAGWSLTRQLESRGYPVHLAQDVAALARQGDAEVVALLLQSGRLLGEALAQAVSLLNPSLVVLGGALADSQDHLLAGVREMVYRRSLPLATRNLQILGSQLADEAALTGCVHLVADAVFAPHAVDAALAGNAG
ncbi:putative NBD/HSP70 family sugar kinase [Silvimonas terrae]|uniref:Putative NBD/HSP70 family sugar kinase n=1 Tax=Silvimonas terrae TaxID=300266 RepID=A0A840RB45_9NEIS|nr:ROK family protein [Silvimonas terrae]MBB5189676.1 putative NBD/HSP70 family sugar kinase [Silvimonas terrae]